MNKALWTFAALVASVTVSSTAYGQCKADADCGAGYYCCVIQHPDGSLTKPYCKKNFNCNITVMKDIGKEPPGTKFYSISKAPKSAAAPNAPKRP